MAIFCKLSELQNSSEVSPVWEPLSKTIRADLNCLLELATNTDAVDKTTSSLMLIQHDMTVLVSCDGEATNVLSDSTFSKCRSVLCLFWHLWHLEPLQSFTKCPCLIKCVQSLQPFTLSALCWRESSRNLGRCWIWCSLLQITQFIFLCMNTFFWQIVDVDGSRFLFRLKTVHFYCPQHVSSNETSQWLVCWPNAVKALRCLFKLSKIFRVKHALSLWIRSISNIALMCLTIRKPLLSNRFAGFPKTRYN